MSSLCSQWRGRAVQLALLALPLAAPAVSAQTQADADLKAISAFTLTMPKYQQYLDATINLANVAAKNPEVANRLDGYGNKSLAEQAKALDGIPQVRGAITATGLSTRDYILTQGALLQTGMAVAMMKDGKVPREKVVKEAGVNPANLDFYQKNEAEIARLAKEAEAKAPKPPAESGSGEDGGEEAGEGS